MSRSTAVDDLARATDELSARFRKAESAWDARIWEMSRTPIARVRAGERGPGVLAELEAALAHTDREAEALRQSAAGEEAAGDEWRRRAWQAMIAGRDDLATQSAVRLREHKEAARELGEEAVRLEALAAAFREVLATLHASPTPTEPNPAGSVG